MPEATQPAPHSQPIAAERMTTAEATVAALIVHGIRTIYALPGVHNDHLFDALFKAGDRIRTVHTRHEQGAGHSALRHARPPGRVVVAVAPWGPGAPNLVTPNDDAWMDSTPLVCITGQVR